MKSIIPATLCLFLLIGFSSCEEDSLPPTSETVAPTSDCSVIPARFAADVLPIIELGCSDESNGACHQAGSPRGGLVDYEGVNRFVQSGDFVERVIRRKDMPPSYSSNVRSLSEAQLDILECWLAAGAPND